MKKFKISHVFIYLLLILLTLICVVPFYIMVINATHSTNELYAGLSVVPGKYLLDTCGICFHGKYAAGLF